MSRYEVFFSDAAGFGILPVEAYDRNHAIDIARAQHPDARMAVMASELLEGQDRHALLAEWMGADGQQ